VDAHIDFWGTIRLAEPKAIITSIAYRDSAKLECAYRLWQQANLARRRSHGSAFQTCADISLLAAPRCYSSEEAQM
jgi:hypothetical protein